MVRGRSRAGGGRVRRSLFAQGGEARASQAPGLGFSLSASSVRRRAGWAASGNLILRARGLLTLPLLTRILGPSGYGEFTAAWSAVAIIAALAQLNVPDGAGRLIVGARTAELADARALIVRRAGAAVAAGVLAVGVAVCALFSHLEVASVPALAATMLLFRASSVHLQYSQNLGRLTRLNVLADLLGITLGLALAVKLGATGVLGGMSVAYLVCSIVAWPRRAGPNPSASERNSFLREALGLALPLLPVSVATWALFSIDSLLLFRFRGSVETGVYSAAYSFASLALILSIVVAAVWAATSQRLLLDSPERLARAQRKVYVVVAIAGAGAILAATALASLAPAILGRHAFGAASAPVPVLAVGFVSLALAKVSEGALYALGLVRQIMLAYVVGAIVNVVLNLVFIPHFGLWAAAWTTLLGYSITAALLFVTYRVRIGRTQSVHA